MDYALFAYFVMEKERLLYERFTDSFPYDCPVWYNAALSHGFFQILMAVLFDNSLCFYYNQE